MKIFKAYTQGLQKTLSSIKIVNLIYSFVLVMGLTIALPFKSVLTKVVGHSLLPSVLLQDFNFTAYEDIMRNYGDAIKPFVQIILWVGIAYLIVSIFTFCFLD